MSDTSERDRILQLKRQNWRRVWALRAANEKKRKWKETPLGRAIIKSLKEAEERDNVED